MDDKKFEHWCAHQEAKISRKRFNLQYSDIVGFLFFAATFILITVAVDSNIIWWIKTIVIISLIIGALSAYTHIDEYFDTMDQTEFVSCVLNKLAREVSFHEDGSTNKDIHRTLDTLKAGVNYALLFPSARLFEKDNEQQIGFFRQLRKLPEELAEVVKENKIQKISPEDLKMLAYALREDSSEKTLILDRIMRKIKDLKTDSDIKRKSFSQIFANQWFLTAITAIVLFVMAFYLHSKWGFEKNNLLIGYVTLLVGIGYIIHKK